MRISISNTAEYGDFTRGPMIVNSDTKATMKKILSEIRKTVFARGGISENKSGTAVLKAKKASH